MSKTTAFIKKEFLEMLPPTLFFFVLFSLVVLTRQLIFQNDDAGMLSYAAAAIAALIVGKSVLIADALPVWHHFDTQPRVLLIVGRTIAYALVALLLQFLEEVIPLARSAGSLSSGVEQLFTEVRWPYFWGTHIQLVTGLAVYNIITVIAEELGRERFIRLMFGRASAD